MNFILYLGIEGRSQYLQTGNDSTISKSIVWDGRAPDKSSVSMALLAGSFIAIGFQSGSSKPGDVASADGHKALSACSGGDKEHAAEVSAVLSTPR